MDRLDGRMCEAAYYEPEIGDSRGGEDDDSELVEDEGLRLLLIKIRQRWKIQFTESQTYTEG